MHVTGLFCIIAALALGAFGDTTTLVYSTVPAQEGRPAIELKLDLYRPAAEGTHPCFVYFHGGSDSLLDRFPLAF